MQQGMFRGGRSPLPAGRNCVRVRISVGIFRFLERTPTEILFGEDDRHLVLGDLHPPLNNTVILEDIKIMLAYSPKKNNANIIEEYSVLK